MLLHETAHANDKKCDHRQRPVAQHVVKDRLKPRDDENHQKRHDREREREHDDRINHRGHDLVLDLLRFLLELREAREDDFEYTAELTGPHHIDVEIVEQARMLGQPFGKGAAALDGIREFVDRALEDRIALLFREHAQAPKERQSRIDQGGQLSRKNHEHLRLHRFSLKEDDVQAAGFSFPRGRLNPRPSGLDLWCTASTLFRNVGGEITSLAQLADRFIC
jgi:hypothetical protein